MRFLFNISGLPHFVVLNLTVFGGHGFMENSPSCTWNVYRSYMGLSQTGKPQTCMSFMGNEDKPFCMGHVHHFTIPTYSRNSRKVLKWRFPNIGIFSQLSSIFMAFSMKSTIQRTGGTPMTMEMPSYESSGYHCDR